MGEARSESGTGELDCFIRLEEGAREHGGRRNRESGVKSDMMSIRCKCLKGMKHYGWGGTIGFGETE